LVDIHGETMGKRSRIQRVRTARTLCKRLALARGVRRQRLPFLLAGMVLTLSACHLRTGPRTVGLAELENAPPAVTSSAQRVVVSDPQALRSMCTSLGPRLGLLQVHSREEWTRLTAVAPQLGPCPDLSRGIVVGIVSWAGTPVDGQWPIHIESVRVHEGAGLVEAGFHGGSYLPDGTAYLETAHVKGMSTVLIVDVNSTSFFPQ
jgi:hypothetical protein